jgi:cytidylate kinase
VTGAGGDPYFGPGVAAFLTEEYEDLLQPTITRGHELEDEKYIEAIHKVLRALAVEGNVVIVGRGAYMILKDDPNVLRVGAVASLDDRISTIMEREHLDWKKAKDVITARDQARSHYFKRFFDIDQPDNPEYYHLTINTSHVDLDYATEMIVQACDALGNGRLPLKTESLVS